MNKSFAMGWWIGTACGIISMCFAIVFVSWLHVIRCEAVTKIDTFQQRWEPLHRI